MFSILMKVISSFHLFLSSVFAFNLDHSEILSFVKGLNVTFDAPVGDNEAKVFGKGTVICFTFPKGYFLNSLKFKTSAEDTFVICTSELSFLMD